MQNCLYSIETEDISDGISSARSPQENASAILRYFRVCGWITLKEIGCTGDNIASVSAYCRKLIDAIHRIFDQDMNRAVEVSLFSAVGAPYELYLSYGRMYGIVYVEKENADIKREEIKKELEQEYQRCKEPTGEFINDFAEKYKLCLPNDASFDADDLFDMF